MEFEPLPSLTLTKRSDEMLEGEIGLIVGYVDFRNSASVLVSRVVIKPEGGGSPILLGGPHVGCPLLNLYMVRIINAKIVEIA